MNKRQRKKAQLKKLDDYLDTMQRIWDNAPTFKIRKLEHRIISPLHQEITDELDQTNPPTSPDARRTP